MFFLAKFASAQEGPMARRGSRRRGRGGYAPHTMPTPWQHVRRRAAGRTKLLLAPTKPIDNVLALCYYDIDNTHKEAIFMKKHPFTPEELEEAAAELDEEAAECVAYCTRCGGAIEVAHDRI